MKKNSGFSKFIILWFGELISSIGSGLTSFGLGVYIFETTGSVTSMALITLLGFLPNLVLSVFAGVLADKYDRRNLMILGDGLSALGIIYILICMFTGNISLIKICIGVFISSVFSSLLEPSYRATITDLLTKDEFSKSSGLVGLAGSARYLISPILAGILLSISDIKLLLIIDICTFIITVLSTLVVRKGIVTKKEEHKESFIESLKQGWFSVYKRKGVLILIVISSLITLFMGLFQILAEPLILSFSSSKILGISETVCASGMLVSSLILGIKGIKKRYSLILSVSLMLSGFGMIGFGLIENIYIICIFGFIFFYMLPYANNCLDYLIRINIPDKLQGRAWGFIGLISQIGYVIAYSISGFLADYFGKINNIGSGRGSAIVIQISGILLIIISIIMMKIKKIQQLETGNEINL